MPKKITRKTEIMEEEQVLLSKERTILSFMRTGLAFVTAGIVIAGFFENLEMAQIVGYLLVTIGFVEVFWTIRKLAEKQSEMNRLHKMHKRY